MKCKDPIIHWFNLVCPVCCSFWFWLLKSLSFPIVSYLCWWTHFNWSEIVLNLADRQGRLLSGYRLIINNNSISPSLKCSVLLLIVHGFCGSSRESSNNSTRSPLKTTMVIQDDSLPAAPPPQIRILKRPASNGSLGSPLNQNRPTPQVKSLAQREAEYAEARKRILGSACPDETPQDKPNTDR